MKEEKKKYYFKRGKQKITDSPIDLPPPAGHKLISQKPQLDFFQIKLKKNCSLNPDRVQIRSLPRYQDTSEVLQEL